MPKRTPQEAYRRYQQTIKSRTQDIRDGVNRVTESPGMKAAAKQDKMRNNLLAAIDSGKWAERVAGVPLEEWKTAMIDKGVPRIAAGVDAAEDKMVAFFGELFDHQDALQRKVHAMSDVTPEDSEARMIEWMRGMRTFKRSRR